MARFSDTYPRGGVLTNQFVPSVKVFRHLPEGKRFSPINLFHLLRCSDTYSKAGGSPVTAFGISRCLSPNKSGSDDIAEKNTEYKR